MARLRTAYPAATIDVLASPSNHEVFEADPGVNRVRIADRTWFERHPSRWGLLGEVWRLGRSIREREVRPGNRRPRRCAVGSGPGPGGNPAAGGMGNGRWRVPAHGRRRLGSRPSRGSLAAGSAGPAGHYRRRSRRGSRCTWPIWIGQPWPDAWPRPGPGRQLDGWRSRSAPAGGTVPTISASRDSPLPKGRRGSPIPTGCTQADSALFPPSGGPSRCRYGGQALAPPALEHAHPAIPA